MRFTMPARVGRSRFPRAFAAARAALVRCEIAAPVNLEPVLVSSVRYSFIPAKAALSAVAPDRAVEGRAASGKGMTAKLKHTPAGRVS